jgi:hypothetical protein
MEEGMEGRNAGSGSSLSLILKTLLNLLLFLLAYSDEFLSKTPPK